jgi:hypothetical protein
MHESWIDRLEAERARGGANELDAYAVTTLRWGPEGQAPAVVLEVYVSETLRRAVARVLRVRDGALGRVHRPDGPAGAGPYPVAEGDVLDLGRLMGAGAPCDPLELARRAFPVGAPGGEKYWRRVGAEGWWDGRDWVTPRAAV